MSCSKTDKMRESFYYNSVSIFYIVFYSFSHSHYLVSHVPSFFFYGLSPNMIPWILSLQPIYFFLEITALRGRPEANTLARRTISGNSVFISGNDDAMVSLFYILLIIRDIPCPPLTQRVAKPSSLFSWIKLCSRVTVIFAPVHPIGWPKAIAPPFLFILFLSHFNS